MTDSFKDKKESVQTLQDFLNLIGIILALVMPIALDFITNRTDVYKYLALIYYAMCLFLFFLIGTFYYFKHKKKYDLAITVASSFFVFGFLPLILGLIIILPDLTSRTFFEHIVNEFSLPIIIGIIIGVIAIFSFKKIKNNKNDQKTKESLE